MEAHSTNIVMAARLTIALFLLLSLCVSRGEGIHLLPFSPGGDLATAEQASVDILDKLFNPLEGFHSKPLQKLGKDLRPVASCGRAAQPALQNSGFCWDRPQDAARAAIKLEKSLFSSGSDRAPPSMV